MPCTYRAAEPGVKEILFWTGVEVFMARRVQTSLKCTVIECVQTSYFGIEMKCSGVSPDKP